MVEESLPGYLMPPGRRLFTIIWPMLAIVVLLVALASISLDLLSATRAYVGGESLWSKGQKDAVYDLVRYAQSHRPADYQAYLAAIAVPYGDHEARLELNKAHPLLSAARTGFVAGHNNPNDVPGMIRLYLWFHHVGPMKAAIGIWAEGDKYLSRLMEAGQALHREIQSGQDSPVSIQTLLAKINGINEHFTPLELRFSATLGTAARQVSQLLHIAMIVAAMLLLVVGIRISGRMLQRSRQYELALLESETRLREAQALAKLGNWTRDLTSGASAWSAEALRMFGFDPALPPPGREQHLAAIHTDDRATVAARWDAAALENSNYTVEYRIAGADGIRWVQEQGQCYNGVQGRINEMIATVMDVTGHKTTEEKIRRLAHYDELTSLPNRTLLYQHMHHLLARYHRHGGHFALLFVDLDHFKRINDTLGHAAGDHVLKEIASRLTGCLRESDMIARFGGDEFIVVVEGNISRDHITTIAEKVCDVVGAPLVINGGDYQVTASIGISLYPDGGTDLDSLCRHADAAMYQAKNRGRNRIGFSDASCQPPDGN